LNNGIDFWDLLGLKKCGCNEDGSGPIEEVTDDRGKKCCPDELGVGGRNNSQSLCNVDDEEGLEEDFDWRGFFNETIKGGVSGAVSGAVGGAVTGAVVGSAAGGVGAGPGALAGAGLGALGGGIAGALNNALSNLGSQLGWWR
jgi:hypothetical protein